MKRYTLKVNGNTLIFKAHNLNEAIDKLESQGYHGTITDIYSSIKHNRGGRNGIHESHYCYH